jgi:hypothetical protein
VSHKRVPQPIARVDTDTKRVHDVQHMSITPAISRTGVPEVRIPEYFGNPLYDIRSGRFDPPGLLYALLLREMTPTQLAAEAGVARSTVFKALSGKGVSYSVALAILGALARHPRSLPPLE